MAERDQPYNDRTFNNKVIGDDFNPPKTFNDKWDALVNYENSKGQEGIEDEDISVNLPRNAAEPLDQYPDQRDVEFSKQYGFYDDLYSHFYDGSYANVSVSQRQALADNKTLDGVFKQEPSSYSGFENLDEGLFAKGKLVANRIPLAALGFDPERTKLDIDKGSGIEVYGAYQPKSDRLYTTLHQPSTIVHESIHRGVELIAKQDPEFWKTVKDKMPDSESIVRYLMATQAGDPEAVDNHHQRRTALKAFKEFPEAVETLEALTEKAAELIKKKRPGGPR